MHDIKESDWKHLRQLKPVALDRLCNRILSEVQVASSIHDRTSHERYLTVYELIRNRDHELGRIFDDLKRSNAVRKLFSMREAGLLTDDEWGGFSEEIKNVYARLQNM